MAASTEYLVLQTRFSVHNAVTEVCHITWEPLITFVKRLLPINIYVVEEPLNNIILTMCETIMDTFDNVTLSNL